ncbi:MAG: tRNA pseudouridine(55) synthase TruB [Caldisericia bacterium]|nr:tRNA pseudouridine(55) synthase TruB [Caldisericia bacterium]
MNKIMGAIPLKKEGGLTSFKSSDRVRRIFNVKKGGYVGTLDEHATGVLLILLGPATKLIRYLPEFDKTYVATFKLGSTSNTFDAWGEVEDHGYDESISTEHINSILSKFSGKIEQIPPMFSAKKIDGKRLYKYALEGKELPRKPTKVEIKSLVLHSYDQEKGEGKFELTCTKGTYVRTLISDIGENAGCGAIMTSLMRTSDNGFSIDDCFTLANIEKESTNENLESLLIPMGTLISHLPQVQIDDYQKFRVTNGNPAKIHGKPARSGLVQMMFEGELYGIGKLVVSTGELHPERIL